MYINIYTYIYIYIIYQYWGIETYFKIITDETGRYLNVSDASSCPLDDWGSRLMFFKILAKRFTVSLGKTWYLLHGIEILWHQGTTFSPYPLTSVFNAQASLPAQKKWCRLLTWQCWNKKHQWTDRHIILPNKCGI